MTPPSSWPQLVFWKQSDRRCELWMRAGTPELRVYIGDTLFYKEVAPLGALYDRAEQLRELRPGTPIESASNPSQ